MGYFEYFQFCEDIGAKPLPVVAAGVCCQNAGNYIPGDPKGQQGLPMSEMPDYVQEVLDLIEWANGPATSKWGAIRAAAGHPDPFKLEYLGVGNEDHITPVFEARFAMIQQANKARHPVITLIGTVGPQVSAPNRAHPVGSVIYCSGLNPTIQRNLAVFTPCDFIAAITQHIPDKSFQFVRCHGWYSNKMRGQRDKRAAKEAKAAGQAVQIIDVVTWITRRGGFLARKGHGSPGIITLWRGWKRLADLTEGWNLATRGETYG